jgi:hypothetical protein
MVKFKKGIAILKRIREVGKDEKTHNDQPDFGGNFFVKRVRLCLARPFRHFPSAFMGRPPWFLLPRVLSSACLLWAGLLR